VVHGEEDTRTSATRGPTHDCGGWGERWRESGGDGNAQS